MIADRYEEQVRSAAQKKPREDYANPDRIEDWEKSGGRVWQSALKEQRLQKRGRLDLTTYHQNLVDPLGKARASAKNDVAGPSLQYPPYTQEASVREQVYRSGFDHLSDILGHSAADLESYWMYGGEEAKEVLLRAHTAYEASQWHLRRDRELMNAAEKRADETIRQTERSNNFLNFVMKTVPFTNALPIKFDQEVSYAEAKKRALVELGIEESDEPIDVKSFDLGSLIGEATHFAGAMLGNPLSSGIEMVEMMATGTHGNWWNPALKFDEFTDKLVGNAVQDLSRWSGLRAASDKIVGWIPELADDVPGDLDPYVLNQAALDVTADAFKEMEEGAPEVFAEYMSMANGDHTMAYGLWFADVQWAKDPETGMDQVAQIEEYIDREWVKQLEDDDFRFTSGVLDALALYGKIPMGAATFAFLLTDEDFQDMVTSREFSDILGEIEKNEYSPAKVLGWEGTALGLSTDLLAGMLFDPTVWMFGPTGRLAVGSIDDVAKTGAVVKSTGMQRHVDDIVHAAQRGDDAYLAHALSEFDELDMLDDVLALVDDAKARGPWTQGLSDDLAKRLEDMRAGKFGPADGFNPDARSVARIAEEHLNSMRPEARVNPSTVARNADGSAITREGLELHVGGIHSTQKGFWWVNPEDGRVMAGVANNIDTPGGIVWTHESIAGKGFLEDGMQALQRAGTDTREVLINLSLDSSMTFHGHSWLTKQTSRMYNRSVPVDLHGKAEMLMERALNAGMRPPNGSKWLQFMGLKDSFTADLKLLGMAGAIRKHINPYTTSRTVAINSPGGFTNALRHIHMLWGENPTAMKDFVARANVIRREAARARHAASRLSAAHPEEIAAIKATSQRVQQLNKHMDWEQIQRLRREALEAQGIKGKAAGDIVDGAKLTDEALAADAAWMAGLDRSTRSYVELRRVLARQQRELNRTLADELKAAADYRPPAKYAEDMQTLLDDVYTQYNREILAPHFQKLGVELTEDGLVPWEIISGRSTGFLGPQVSGGMDIAKKIPATSGLQHNFGQLVADPANVGAVQTLSSPLEMVAASSVSGRRYRAMVQKHGAFEGARNFLDDVNNVWVIDKVISGATAAAVTADEWLRIFHRWGLQTTREWAMDKSLKSAYGAKRAMTKNPHMSEKNMERLRRIHESPTQLRQMETMQFDQVAREWRVVNPKDPNYAEVVRTWYGSLMDDASFRAWLQGDDAITDFFFSSEGAYLREKGAWLEVGGKRTSQLTPELVKQGWDEFFKALWAKVPAQQRAELRRYLQEAATNHRTGNVVGLPDHIVANAGPVIGTARAPSGGTGLKDSLMDRLFNNPTNYRRGFVNDMVRRAESERLTRLYASQGKRIVSNIEAEAMLRAKGYAYGASDYRGGLQADALLYEMGVVTQRQISRLVEARVLEEVHNMMYVWQQSSRAGKYGRRVAPFGKPWADMVAFWGREAITRPQMRGWLNNTNAPGLKQIASIAAKSPVNPRPLAMISRIAQTDFEIDRGWSPFDDDVNEGLLPGSTSSDPSRLLFFPTAGDNPLGMLVPGLGYLPIAAMHGLLELWNNTFQDDDVLELENMKQNIGQVVEGFDYSNTTNPFAFLLGSGNYLKTLSVGQDLASMRKGKPGAAFADITPNPFRQVDILRETSAMLAEEDGLQALLAAEDEETVEALIAGISADSVRAAAGESLAKTVFNWALPTRSKFDESVTALYNVWAEAGQRFPEALDPNPDFDPTRPGVSPQEIYEYGNKVRQRFYDAPDWQRQAWIAAYPEIAINVVSTWEWTDLGRSQLGVEGRYVTENTKEWKINHEAYVRQGYIKPKDPAVRIREVLARVAKARRDTLGNAYKFQVEAINEWQWNEFVSDDTKAYLEGLLDTDLNFFGAETARELWQGWGSYEASMEEVLAQKAGVTKFEEDYQGIRDAIKIPTQSVGGIGTVGKAWSTGFPGWGDGPRMDFLQLTALNMFESDQVRELFESQGWDYDPGMSGEAFWSQIGGYREDHESAVWSYVAGDNMAASMGGFGENLGAMGALKELATNSNLDPDYRQRVNAYIMSVDTLARRASDQNRSYTYEEMDFVREGYLTLQEAGKGFSMSWDKVWEQTFQNTFGELDWTPPEPAPLRDESGEVTGEAITPFIRDIIDGDSLVVSRQQAAGIFGKRPFDMTGPAESFGVRLLGVRAADFGRQEEAQEDLDRLEEAIYDAVAEGKMIYLVPDSKRFGYTDPYGRLLAWLYIGDEPFLSPNAFLPGGR
jgi:hypothetical protein